MLVRESNLNQKSFEYPKDWGQGGRGVWAGGGSSSPANKKIEYITISTPAASTSFGNLSPNSSNQAPSGTSGRGRGIFAGGGAYSSPINVICYITIATPADATDFGDLAGTRYGSAAVSNGTRALICGRHAGSGGGAAGVQSIEYITIATPGNGTLFGNMYRDELRESSDGCGNGIYGMIMTVPTSGNPQGEELFERITIATHSSAMHWGNPINVGLNSATSSNGIRAFWSGGVFDDQSHANIEYYTWSSLSNATQYGNLANANDSQYGAGIDNGSRAVIQTAGTTSSSGSGITFLYYFSMDLAAGTAVISSGFGMSGISDDGANRYGIAACAGD